MRRKDGSEIWVEDHCAYDYDEHGMITFHEGILRDITERKRMEDQLRRSTQFLETIIENANVWLDVIDLEGNVLVWNKAAESISGYSQTEVTGHGKIWEWLYPDDGYRKQIMDSIPNPQQDLETQIKRKDGETKIISWNERYLVGDRGKNIGSIVIGQDITEQKRMEDQIKRYSEHLEELVKQRTENLTESEARYRRLFESSPISLWEEDFSEVKKYLDHLRSQGVRDLGKYLTEHPEDLAKCASMVKVQNANDTTLGMYGAKSVEELKGELHRFFTHEFQNNFREELAALSEGEKQFESEFDSQTLTGEIKHVNLILNVVPGYEQTLGKVLVSIVDLTERRRIEEELRASREQLEHVIMGNPAVIYIGKPLPDLSNYYTNYQSRNTVSITGFEADELMGEKGAAFWTSRVHPDDLAAYNAGLPEFWRDGHKVWEYRFLHKDGTYRWIREEANAIRDSRGAVKEIIGYWIDMTERKDFEQRLQQAEHLAAVGETAAMVAHDLRNPLQGIAGATYLLKEESLTAEERNEMVRLIENNVEYSDGIVKDLLDYSRTFELALTETTPKKIVANTLRILQVPSRIRVEDLSQEQPTVLVDMDRMKRAFVNLVENAVDAMPNGGTLTITTKESNGHLEIAFADTGTGLPEEILENLWKPLQTTKAKGMGLGLPIVKRIVQAHGGDVSVKSKAGEGTTYTIRLPLKSNLRVATD